MSIFPRRARPGGEVTLHVRMLSPPVHFGLLRASVRDPAGVVAVAAEWPILSVPPGRAVKDEHRVRITAGIYEAPPLLLVADHLREQSGGSKDFMRVLGEMGRATHRYVTYRVPPDAPLGRHQLLIELFADGERFCSSSADTDCFHVEELRLLAIRGTGAKRTALVENPSPEPVPVKVCELREQRDGKLDCAARMIALPPATQTAVPCPREGTFLFYAEDRGRLSLCDPRAPLCVRDPRCRAMVHEERAEIHVHRAGEEHAYVLSGRAREIWKAANGTRSRAELRRRHCVSQYDQLLRRGLIWEIPVDEPITARKVVSTVRKRALAMSGPRPRRYGD